MKHQMKFLSPKELYKFIDCDITEDAYVNLLRERGHLPPTKTEEPHEK